MKSTSPSDDAITAGRGFLFISGAKFYFLAASAFLALGLPRLLGDPGLFGRYRVVNALISILNMVMIVGTIQTVSKLVSENEERSADVRKRALGIQFMIGGGIALVLALGAPWIAGALFHDAGMAIYIQVGAVVTGFYAIYAVFVGLLNGAKRFAAQAALDSVFTTLKVGLIVGLVLAGYGVLGAFVGFAIAAIVITVIGAVVAARLLPSGDAQISRNAILRILVPIFATTLMINLLIQLDILAIKSTVVGSIQDALLMPAGERRLAWLFAPLGVPAPPNVVQSFATEAVDRLAGLYGGAKNLALLPYQLTFALTFVVFPLVSHATFVSDRERSQQTIRQAMRFALLLAVLAAVVLAAVGEPALQMLLGADYGSAFPALAVLLAATVMTALVVLGLTILNSAGMERHALAVSALTVLLYVGLIYWLLPTADDLREGTLLRLAQCSLAATSVGVVTVLCTLAKRFAWPLCWRVLLRAGLAAGAVVGVVSLWQVDSLPSLAGKALSSGLLFVLFLTLMGELNKRDLDAVKRVIGGRK